LADFSRREDRFKLEIKDRENSEIIKEIVEFNSYACRKKIRNTLREMLKKIGKKRE